MILDSILTVVTPAASQDLVDLDAVKDELRITDTSQTTYLNRIKRQASSAIASYCGRVFIAETVAEQFRARGPVFGFFGSAQFANYLVDPPSTPRGSPIVLRRYPVVSIMSVIADDVTLVEDTDYEVDAERGFLYRITEDLQCSWDFAKLTVTYSGGYTQADVPDDLQAAALRLITARYTSRGRDPMLRSYDVPGVLSETFWVGAVGDDGALPPEVTGLIDQYKEMRV